MAEVIARCSARSMVRRGVAAVVLTSLAATGAAWGTAALGAAGPAWGATAGLSPNQAATGQPADPEIRPQPVSIVLLVDESGSLQDAGVAAEREAAAFITQAELASSSQVTVIGFGGSTNLAGQVAVQVRCQSTTVATSQDRDYLSRCVQDLHRRTKAEGDATDYPRALDQALSVFASAPADARKILFLLTDGQLDVSEDPTYGQNSSADDRNAAALRRMHDGLARARDAGVQVWPLGFGRAQEGQLADFAARGSQQLCGPRSPSPRARVVSDPGQVADSLAEAYAAARCAGVNRSPVQTLEPGDSVTLAVEVPRIATDGSIAVVKRDPRIKVEYHDPNGRVVPKSGTDSDGVSTFQISGEGGAIEVLRITDPLPGRWQVRLVSSPEVSRQNVAATVIWQGAVRSTVTLNPPSPRPGETAVAQVVLETRRQVLTGSEVLTGVDVLATLTGEGFEPVQLTLADDGSGRDERLGDGRFSAEVAVPGSASGQFRLVGAVGGVGIASADVPFEGRVNTGQAQIRAQLRLSADRVAPGASLGGTVEVTNDSGAARTLRLQLGDLSQGTLATVSPPTVQLPASGVASLPFLILFADDTQLGSRGALLRLVDDADPSLEYANLRVVVQVAHPPSTLYRLRYLLAAVAALLIAVIVAILLWLRRRQGMAAMPGVVLLLFRDETQLGFLAAPERQSAQFWFVIRDLDGSHPRLDHSADGEGYVATRGPAGVVLVRGPNGQKLRLKTGTLQPVAQDLTLGVRDERDRDADSGRRRRFDRGDRSTGRLPVAEGASATQGSARPATTYDDLL